MTKKNTAIMATAAILVLSMAALAFAGPGYGRGMRNGPQAGYSQLTPEKQAAVEKIFDKYQPKLQELRDQMFTKHSTLQAMVNGGNADEAAIGKLTSDMTDLRDQMRDTRDAMRAELEKETGVVGFGGRGYGRGSFACAGDGYGRGMGGYGHGMGYGRGMGFQRGYGDCPNGIVR